MIDKKYRNYLKSIEWEILKNKVLEINNYSCSKCWNDTNLHIHHWTYIRLYNEELTDLFCLCNICHKEFHRLYWTKDMLRATKSFISWEEYVLRKWNSYRTILKIKKAKRRAKSKRKSENRKQRLLLQTANASEPRPNEHFLRDEDNLFTSFINSFMDTESTIIADGTPVPIKSSTLSNFFDDIVMVDETSRKPKYVCEGCAG